ncbi:MAG: DAK2 domain-containing protein, partial [Lachnospiraceae bacterium]|nr:DAK2 domain-containing protein [Lachnospiraceae bacterium]
CAEIIECGDEVLARTPDMLPVLKEAGVVDSGGQGLMEFLKGAYNGLLGIDTVDVSATATNASKKADVSSEEIDTSHIKYGYCTEFIILLEKEYNMEIEATFKEYLTGIGDSLVVVSDDEIVKVHVHTNHPGLAFEKGLEFGQLTSMKIDNMREEHREKVIMEQDKRRAEQIGREQEQKKVEKKPYGFVAVSVGDGLDEIFKELGVDVIITGGQTMNPSTEDVLSAIGQAGADTVFVLPNNKNIILAANQAADIAEDVHVVVIESKTIPQGISAMIGFNPEADTDANYESMNEAIQTVASGQVTYAVRDTSVDGKEIKTGDYMGIGDKGICSVGTDIQSVVTELVEQIINSDSELISVYYGSDVTEDAAEAMVGLLEEKYPDYEIELHMGGQPIYYYIISVE